MTDNELRDLVDSAVTKLSEHFDAVQIHVSWSADQTANTRFMYRGSGNVFARQGMAADYLESGRQWDSANILVEKMNEGPDT